MDHPTFKTLALLVGVALASGPATAAPGIRAEPSMDVRQALSTMREAALDLEAGRAAQACERYEAVLRAFPTWWMALVGSVRCGIARGDAPEGLRLALQRAEKLGATPALVKTLRGRIELLLGHRQQAAKLMLSDAARGARTALPPAELFWFAWRSGRLREVLALGRRLALQGAEALAARRVMAEAALLLGDYEVASQGFDLVLPVSRDRALAARWIRWLEGRGHAREASAWRDRVRRW